MKTQGHRYAKSKRPNILHLQDIFFESSKIYELEQQH